MDPSGPPQSRIIALMNQKGGVGKTTTTVNLGAAIAQRSRSVLIVDLDPQAHATLHMGIDPQQLDGSTYDVLLDPEHDPSHSIIKINEHLSLLPSETDLAAAESELASANDRQGRLTKAFETFAGQFEFILVDCPPSLGLLTLNALAAAKEVFIPMQAHFLALQGVGKLLETVSLVSQRVNPRLAVTGIILCMHDSQTTHAQEVVADLDSFFEAAREQDVPWRTARVLRPPVRRNIKLAECPSFGQTIFDYAPTAPGAKDYLALGDVVIGDWDKLKARRANAASAQIEVVMKTPQSTETHA